ncbi:extracellular solute-binding protein [Variovorax sp. J22P240]|uniref:ABC transporter substrate-binding protein n=1 Tax=unclassified Variovorax TaxID=663243 RepID=UPI0025777821|nr:MULTISPECIES: extracellular solute-binding protein [unclassified Variovorax]MDM0001606.1 extracellular solute-binding protein [Variovorax sp. J22P240]MDM0053192.1 extracellular solute-binding protein [Variovorax sp. J22R115]
MSDFNRRKILKSSAGIAAAASLGVGTAIFSPLANAQTLTFKPEKGAKLRVLRWSRFVQGDIDAYMANVKRFTETTGVEVRVDNEGWEDVRPKAAVAANTGAGPDIILSTNDDANLYPDKLLDVTDLAEYLGKKYGGWYPAAEMFMRPDGKKWIGLALGASGSLIVYRESMVKAAGFDKFPTNTDDFLKLYKAMKDKGTPGGMALGNATGDSVWTNWLIWSFGGKLVDKNNKVVIDSPETLKALEYAKELYANFIPGTLSWLDPNNNKAFLDGQIGVTNNGISIYYTAKNSSDPKVKEMAADINHAVFPVGPVGVPTESHLFFNQMIMKYTKYPQASKEFLRFMMERPQFDDWLKGGGGYVAQPLRAYEANPIWTSDPKNTPYRDSVKNLRPAGYEGKLGYASAGAAADFIIPNMVAEAASGSKTPKEAAERAQKRAERYYKV